MLSCSMRRQNSALLHKRTHWSNSSARFVSTSSISTSTSTGICTSGGLQRETCPIKHLAQSARAHHTVGTRTPRFCSATFAAPGRRHLHSQTITTSNTLRPATSSSPPSLFNPLSGLDKAHFSTSGAVMGAVKIDGTAIAKRIRASLLTEIEEKKKINPRYIPSLKIIQGTSTLIGLPWQHVGTCSMLTFMTLKWATAVTLVSSNLTRTAPAF